MLGSVIKRSIFEFLINPNFSANAFIGFSNGRCMCAVASLSAIAANFSLSTSFSSGTAVPFLAAAVIYLTVLDNWYTKFDSCLAFFCSGTVAENSAFILAPTAVFTLIASRFLAVCPPSFGPGKWLASIIIVNSAISSFTSKRATGFASSQSEYTGSATPFTLVIAMYVSFIIFPLFLDSAFLLSFLVRTTIVTSTVSPDSPASSSVPSTSAAFSSDIPPRSTLLFPSKSTLFS